jgi:hypothetical protein
MHISEIHFHLFLFNVDEMKMAKTLLPQSPLYVYIIHHATKYMLCGCAIYNDVLTSQSHFSVSKQLTQVWYHMSFLMCLEISRDLNLIMN